MRARETRAAEARPAVGSERPGRLEFDPKLIPAHLEATWIRESCHGQRDDENVIAAQERDGYEPATTDLIPLRTSVLPGRARDDSDNLIRRGGQILMVRPREIAVEAKMAHQSASEEALKSVARDVDARMDGQNFQEMPNAGVTQQMQRGRRGAGKFPE